jgi:hypothetical protein
MALFNAPRAGDYPKQWKDMSLEFKMMFVYHGCMMFLFMTGGAFSVHQELMLTGVLLLLLTWISLDHRGSTGWRWQGVKPKNLFFAAGGAVLTGALLYSATPLFPPQTQDFYPGIWRGLALEPLMSCRHFDWCTHPKRRFWRIVTNPPIQLSQQYSPIPPIPSGTEL